MTTIVVADDHKIVREGLVKLLEGRSDFSVVGEAADGEEAVKMVISGGIVTPPDRRSALERATPQVSAETYEQQDVLREKRPSPISQNED